MVCESLCQGYGKGEEMTTDLTSVVTIIGVLFCLDLIVVSVVASIIGHFLNGGDAVGVVFLWVGMAGIVSVAAIDNFLWYLMFHLK